MTRALEEMDLIEPPRLAACVIDDIVIDRRRARDARQGLTAREALLAIKFEAQLVAVAAENQAQGLPLSDDDRARLLVAWGRIDYIVSEVAG